MLRSQRIINCMQLSTDGFQTSGVMLGVPVVNKQDVMKFPLGCHSSELSDNFTMNVLGIQMGPCHLFLPLSFKDPEARTPATTNLLCLVF